MEAAIGNLKRHHLATASAGQQQERYAPITVSTIRYVNVKECLRRWLEYLPSPPFERVPEVHSACRDGRVAHATAPAPAPGSSDDRDADADDGDAS
jgi:hypothetical protein